MSSHSHINEICKLKLLHKKNLINSVECYVSGNDIYKKKTINNRKYTMCFRCGERVLCYVFFTVDCFSLKLCLPDGYICILCFEYVKKRILHNNTFYR